MTHLSSVGSLGLRANSSRTVTIHWVPEERAAAVLHALDVECEALGIERGSPEFWREAERRVERPITSSASMRADESDGRLP